MLVFDSDLSVTERQLSVELTSDARQFVIDNGYDPVYGARPLKRYLQKHVETLAARIILGGEISEGDVIQICLDGDHLGATVISYPKEV